MHHLPASSQGVDYAVPGKIPRHAFRAGTWLTEGMMDDTPRHIGDQVRRAGERYAPPAPLPLVSQVLPDGTIVELVRKPEENRTLFCVGDADTWIMQDKIQFQGRTFVPYSANNNLIRNEVVLLPSQPEEYGSEEDLLAEIRQYIHRWVDVSPLFEQVAAYYALFCWVHDAFRELPYLRARGDYGSGKTRFLLILGSICYKPIFASGASTVSPLFRILDAFRGTLIIDESDFRYSDESAEMVKILNNGNAKGFPVLRSELNDKKEYNPRAYHVFGPKLVASRGAFEDRALESRFLTEEMGQRILREDIPINLSDAYKEEALALRNKLLLFRLRNLTKKQTMDGLVDRTIEPRLNQIFIPLLSIIEDPAARESLRELARSYHREMVEERGMDAEAQILEIIRGLVDAGEPRWGVREITQWFGDRYGEDYERKITAKWIGGILRRKLGIKTQKSHGVYVIPLTEKPKLDRLWVKYGIDSPNEPKPSGAAVSPSA